MRLVRVSALKRSTSSQPSMLGANLGAGVLYGLRPNWAVRGDVRGLAMLPWGEELRLTPAREVDAMWMERATIGLAYRF